MSRGPRNPTQGEGMADTGGQARPILQAGTCEVDLAWRELRTDGVRIAIGGRAFEIMEALVRQWTACHQGRADGPHLAGHDRRRKYALGACLGGAQGARHAARPAEDGIRPRLSPARSMDPALGRSRRHLAGSHIEIDSSQTAGSLPNVVVGLFGREASVRHLSDLLLV